MEVESGREEEAVDRLGWWNVIHCGDPKREKM